MKFTHKQLTLIQNALRIAAIQFYNDRATSEREGLPRVADQFYHQAQEANELADWIDNQE